MLTTIEKVLFLQSVEIFSALTPENLAKLALIAHEVDLPTGTKLLESRATANSLYLILTGEVALERKGEKVAVASEREAVGTWALFDKEPSVFDATTVAPTHALRIDSDEFYDLLSDYPEITQKMFQTLVRRLRKLAGA